jgi:galactoside 2-L-fucosyltransferase 1/2
MVGKDWQERGAVFPPKSYFQNAMLFFTDEHNDVLFIVTSDNIAWCRDYFAAFPQRIVYTQNAVSAVDMALLASCEHVILTIGTFGFWAGWFNSGITIYYPHYARPGSWMEHIMGPKTFIPKNDKYNTWIPIT